MTTQLTDPAGGTAGKANPRRVCVPRPCDGPFLVAFALFAAALWLLYIAAN